MIGFLLALSAPVLAWDSHRELTRLALSGVRFDESVRAESLETYLASKGLDLERFLKSIEVQPRSSFGFGAGESEGSEVPLRRVLEAYSDEPDLGMDRGIFEAYPELWRPEYVYMGGGRGGLADQAVRHMRWPAGYLKLVDGRIAHDPAQLGEGHRRARLYYGLSLEAFRSGRPYWGARFLAWSLHYVQDLAQPFHATQLPSMAFLRTRGDGSADVEATIRNVAYLHLAYESYAARLLEAEGDAGADLRTAVAGSGGEDASGDIEAFAAKTALRAHESSAATAASILGLFPPAGAAAPEPDAVAADRPFWEALERNRASRSAEFGAFRERLAALLGQAGTATRAVVRQAREEAAAEAKRRRGNP